MRIYLIFGFLLCALGLEAKSLSYEHIEVEMRLNRDTSIDVIETQHVWMDGEWNGLYRDYNPKGADAIEINALYEQGHAYQRGNIKRKGGYVVEPQDNGNLKVKWRSVEPGESVHDLRTDFAIHYKIMGAIGQFKARDVFYWKPLFQDRDYPIRQASVRFKLPEPVELADVTFFSKVPDAEWRLNESRDEILFTASEIPTSDVFEIKIELPKGILESYYSAANRYRFHVKPFFLPIALFCGGLFLFALWWLIGRDPVSHAGRFLDLELEDEAPGLMGIMDDERFDHADLTATILDLARRGYLELSESEHQGLIGSRTQINMKLLEVPAEGELRAFEQILLEGLFGSHLEKGESTSTERLKNKFYTYIPKIKKAAWEEVIAAKWFAFEPRLARKVFIGLGIVLVGLGGLLATKEAPEVGFILLWGSMFAGIPSFMLVHAVKRGGWLGALKSFFVLPFIVIGFGVMTGFLLPAYLSGGLYFDWGLSFLALGIATIVLAPTFGRKSRAGVAMKKRIEVLKDRLVGQKEVDSAPGDFAQVLPGRSRWGLLKSRYP